VDETSFVRGQYEPRKTLETLLPKKAKGKLVDQLEQLDMEPIRNNPEIRELKQFFKNGKRKAAA
jgi:hypothetical protein